MRFWLLTALTLFAAGCAGTASGGSLIIEGKIIDDGGSVYDNVELQLAASDGTVLQTTMSGGGGFFSFPDVGPGVYNILLDVENQMDGPIPAEPFTPFPVTVGPDGPEGGGVILKLQSTLSSSERLWGKYAADMASWDSENADPANRGAVVFAGSSSIRLWSTLARDFPAYRVLNRGFGGSTAAELRQVLDKVTAVQPAAVIIYEGDNDLASEGTEAESFLAHMEALTAILAETVRKDRILLLSIKPSRARAARWPVYQNANLGLQRLALIKGYTFVDVSTPMLVDGKVNDLYMGNDGLHMSAEGYALWKSLITPNLDRVMSR